MTDPDHRGADRPTDQAADRAAAAPPSGRGWWNPLTRAVALVLLTVALAALAGHITITVRLTGAWPVGCTVELLTAAVYAAVIVGVAATAAPGRGGRR